MSKTIALFIALVALTAAVSQKGKMEQKGLSKQVQGDACHDHWNPCDENHYCDEFEQCWALSECYYWDDAIDGECPIELQPSKSTPAEHGAVLPPPPAVFLQKSSNKAPVTKDQQKMFNKKVGKPGRPGKSAQKGKNLAKPGKTLIKQGDAPSADQLVGECSEHWSVCGPMEYCDHFEQCWPLDECYDYNDSIDGACPITWREVKTDAPGECGDHWRVCDSEHYCDEWRQCWALDECEYYDDAIDGECPLMQITVKAPPPAGARAADVPGPQGDNTQGPMDTANGPME